MEYSKSPIFTTQRIADLKAQKADFKFVLATTKPKRGWSLIATLDGVDHVFVAHSTFKRRVFKSAEAVFGLLDEHFPEIEEITLPFHVNRVEKFRKVSIELE